MQIPWYVSALGAALVWGVHYPLIDYALKKVSLISVLMLTAIPVLLFMPVFATTLADDVKVFSGLSGTDKCLILATAITGLSGAFLVYLSIQTKNATLASLIEITYPVFVVVFAYVLFKQVHINTSVVIGGLLVMTGAGIIIFNNS